MIEYKMYKTVYGWKAESQVELDNSRILTVSTMKRSNGSLCTYAQVGKVKGGLISHMMFQDFSKLIEFSNPKKVTQKAVETQHIGIVIENIVAEINAFYA